MTPCATLSSLPDIKLKIAIQVPKIYIYIVYIVYKYIYIYIPPLSGFINNYYGF